MVILLYVIVRYLGYISIGYYWLFCCRLLFIILGYITIDNSWLLYHKLLLFILNYCTICYC